MGEKPCYLANISTDVLVRCLSYLNNFANKRSFAKFWIGCTGCTSTRLLIHSALLNIDVPYFLEKCARSALSKYLTYVRYNKHGDDSYLQFLMEKQQYHRLKKIELLDLFTVSHQPPNELIGNFKQLKKLVATHSALTASFLKTIKKLNSLRLYQHGITNDIGPDCVFENVTKLHYTKYDFVVMFPNLVKLCLDLLSTKKLDDILDLSSMIFLEKFEVRLLSWSIFPNKFKTKLDVIVSSSNMREIKISPNIKLISTTQYFGNVESVSVSDYLPSNPYTRKFRSVDLFIYSKNIKKLFLNTNLVSILPLVKYTPKLIHLAIYGNVISSPRDQSKYSINESVDVLEFYKCVIALKNLTRLEMSHIDIHAKHLNSIYHLCWQSTYIKWNHIKFLGIDTTDYVPQVYALKSVQTFDVTLDSNYWSSVVEYFAQITQLTLFFLVQWDGTFATNVNEFCILFFTARNKLITRILNGDLLTKTVCRKISIETRHLGERLETYMRSAFPENMKSFNREIDEQNKIFDLELEWLN
jgi:hypothetical protein